MAASHSHTHTHTLAHTLAHKHPTSNQSPAVTSLTKVFRESKFRLTPLSLIPDLFNNMIWGTSIQGCSGASRGLKCQGLYPNVIVACLGFVSNLLVRVCVDASNAS